MYKQLVTKTYIIIILACICTESCRAHFPAGGKLVEILSRGTPGRVLGVLLYILGSSPR